jgi:flavin reductase (DIM6/NTAB) family NADH-FMN oxidoreductase RutF
MILDLKDLKTAERQYYLQHVIAPRPICFASTMDKEGNVNLSPFSFFNMFSSNPPIVVFSPVRRIRDGATKHTLQNLLELPEVVINIVTYDIVEQTSLASCEFPKGVNEFIKGGFTPIPATLVRPPMVKESKANLECKVLEIKPLGTGGGAGNLVICEVLRMHIDDSLLGSPLASNPGLPMIDQRKIHHVARLGGDWYCQVNENSLFQVEKPTTQLGIGMDTLPVNIRNSNVLSGNDLGKLASVRELPVVDPAFNDDHLKKIIQYFSLNPDEMEKELQLYAKKLISQGKVKEAWQVLLTDLG